MVYLTHARPDTAYGVIPIFRGYRNGVGATGSDRGLVLNDATFLADRFTFRLNVAPGGTTYSWWDFYVIHMFP